MTKTGAYSLAEKIAYWLGYHYVVTTGCLTLGAFAIGVMVGALL